MTVCIEENVLRLEVPVHYTIRMKVGNSRYYFSCIRASKILSDNVTKKLGSTVICFQLSFVSISLRKVNYLNKPWL